VLNGVFAFLLDIDSVTGTYAEKRIENVLKRGKEAATLYKPREGGIGKSR
jgi:hypothetical protein